MRVMKALTPYLVALGLAIGGSHLNKSEMLYSDDAIKMHYMKNEEQLDLPRYKNNKMEIAVFETREYTAEGAWAHTVPSAEEGDKHMCILPPEIRDYRLPIHKHEALHNIYPHASEGFVTRSAFNPSFDIEFKNRVRLVYR
ncbi:MAG: hypothetical protein QMD85_00520 [Candidatus Aenigmarchaeota archaeon]|nr:hypothetical protein [Candidatus Aenigmarchaeota archaeon]MDI6722003.1 hypothetical protein [Candidatus Aenigmarchaeota archaeon]